MEWYQNLYTDRLTAARKDKIIADIQKGRYPMGIWLITLASNPENQLDLLPAGELKFPYRRRNCPLIIGIAGGKESALNLLEQIVKDVYSHTQDVKLRDYFMLEDDCDS